MIHNHNTLQATVDDIIFHDQAAERRATALDVSWDLYLSEASKILIEDLQHGWFPRYVERQSSGLSLTKVKNNRIFSNFDPQLLITSNVTLIRLHAFKAIEIFYSTLVTDVSNVNEVDAANLEYSTRRFRDEWSRAINLNNFYDANLDGEIDMTEDASLDEDTSFYNQNRRYF